MDIVLSRLGIISVLVPVSFPVNDLGGMDSSNWVFCLFLEDWVLTGLTYGR